MEITSMDFVWIMLAVFGYFIGRAGGIKAEAKWWIRHAIEQRDVKVGGLIYQVTCIGEDE